MAHDIKFIMDLQDEGLLSKEIAAELFLGNHSLIGEGNLRIYSELVHQRCSVNQSKLSGWAWLIGNNGSTLNPMLCIARQRDTCESYPFKPPALEALLVFSCLFGIMNLITLAVWCRCKAPAVQREVDIQLLLLRVFSILDIVAPLSNVVSFGWLAAGGSRVFNIFHAILLAQVITLFSAFHLLCYSLHVIFNFLTAIYLVENSHVSQRVLLFTSLRRARGLLLASLLLCIFECVPLYLINGYVYCVKADTAYLLGDTYDRISYNFVGTYFHLISIVTAIFSLLTIILLIVFASKCCCSCCRGPASVESTGSVTYARQQDDADEEASEPPVVIALGPSVPQSSGLADELRQLIFWQQVSYILLLVVAAVLVVASIVVNHAAGNILHVISLLLLYIILFSRLSILSPILSPTYRRSFVSLIMELKDSVISFVHSRSFTSLQ